MKDIRKPPTVHDIAKHLKVSASTVSRALNNHPKISQHTINKVKKAAISLGYAQNHYNPLQKEIIGHTIAILVPNLKETKYNLLIEAARNEFEKNNIQVLIFCTSDQTKKEKQILFTIENLGIEGILASIANESKHPEHFNEIAKKIPLVLFDKINFEITCNKVMFDHFQAGYKAVQHLLKTGCKKIAHIGGNNESPLTKQISIGYRTASRNSSIQFGGKLELFSDSLYKDVNDAIDLILNQKIKPDAILIDDILAAQKMVSILQTKQIEIPKEIALVAIGDENDYSYYSPSITTIQLPYGKMGQSAARMLINHIIHNENKEITSVIPFQLNIKNSTLR